jgi:acyl-CoA reductase-like NAD-dependent aldehyde dehydrogenase
VSAPLEDMAAVTRLWAQLRVPDRARYLERVAQAVIDEFDDLCLALAAESRRPRAEIAALELLAAIDVANWLGAHAQRLLGAHRFPLPRALHPLTRASAGHAPVGVLGVRGASGAPFAEPLAVLGAALLAGNGAILAPAADAGGAAERIVGVVARAGIPEGLVRIGPTEGCPAIIDLAGGPAGPDAMLVLADANVAHAVDGALWGACAGGGLLAGSVKRAFVAREHAGAFVEELVLAAAQLEIGDPLHATTQMSPLADPAPLAAAIDEALAGGATLHARDGLAVLTGVPAGARLARERVPGPVIGVTAVEDSVEAVALANAPQRSLGASIWSADRRAAVRVARELEARVVWGNDHPPALPARQVAADALPRCTRAQLIAWDPAARRPPWRFPYDAAAPLAARALAGLASARDGDRERALRDGGPSVVRVARRALRR